MTQTEKAEQLRQLHRSATMLVLPNIWDPLGALLLQSLGYPAIATASAAVAYSEGFLDGEQLPFDRVLQKLKQITGAVNLPVTADIEAGYAESPARLRENIDRLLDTGIAGINLEDSFRESGELFSLDKQTARIAAIREQAGSRGLNLFINARCDLLLNKPGGDSKPIHDQLMERAEAYRQAGADCFFPILLRQEDDIRRLTGELEMPVNILAVPGIPAIARLQELGVSRLSLGPGFLKVAVKAMRDLAMDLKAGRGLDRVTGNDVTSDYLQQLVGARND